MDLASAWRYQIPGGLPTLAGFTLGIGVLVFTTLEGLPHTDAMYASVITGTYCVLRANVKRAKRQELASLNCVLGMITRCFRSPLGPGTTIGYGDLAPSSNVGKIAVALYAIASVNVMAILLEPARRYLELFCRTKPKMD